MRLLVTIFLSSLSFVVVSAPYNWSLRGLEGFSGDTSRIRDDKGGGYEVSAVEGMNNTLQYKGDISPRVCSDFLSYETQFFFPRNYKYSTGVQKLPFGLKSSDGCLSGGCLVSEPMGASVRLMEKQGEFVIYIYDLYSRQKHSPPWRVVFGRPIMTKIHTVEGRWVNARMRLVDVFLGYLGRFEYDGRAKYFYLAKPSVNTCLSGVILTSHWGGDKTRRVQWSKTDQSYYFKSVFADFY